MAIFDRTVQYVWRVQIVPLISKTGCRISKELTLCKSVRLCRWIFSSLRNNFANIEKYVRVV